MGENVWDFRKRLTLLLASAVIIAVVFLYLKYFSIMCGLS